MANIPTIGDGQELSDKKPDVIQMRSVDKSQLVSDHAIGRSSLKASFCIPGRLMSLSCERMYLSQGLSHLILSNIKQLMVSRIS
jgi:hypothetical protein